MAFTVINTELMTPQNIRHMFTTIKQPEIGLLVIFICYIFLKLHIKKLVAILILQKPQCLTIYICFSILQHMYC